MTRAEFELQLAIHITASRSVNMSLNVSEATQVLAQKIADAYEDRGYFSTDPGVPLTRYITTEGVPNNSSGVRQASDGAGTTRVQQFRTRENHR